MMEHQRMFGSYLRSERELRQIPLLEVAKATKVPLRTLESLERGFWEELPPDVFVRGFVRSYAKHIGLPINEACRRFNETIQKLKHEELDLQTESVGEAAAAFGGRRKFGLALFVIILLIIATITLSLFWRSGASADTHANINFPSLQYNKLA
jgi:cytoskeletal protein RodZ